MKKILKLFAVVTALTLCICTFGIFPASAQDNNGDITLKIGNTVVNVQWENNNSVTALKEMLSSGKVTVKMSMYGGFEQVGSLGKTLPNSDKRMTTQPGDIVLYSSDQIVIFYGSNTWSYTKLGSVKGMSASQLKDLLGSSNVTVELSTVKKQESTETSAKMLVAYFSRTNNTKKIADSIIKASGADKYEIKAAFPYSDDDINYNDSSCRANREQNDKTVRPKISGTVDISGYDVVFLGYPIWWNQEPRIIDTFLESHDFSGKTVIPFCTSGGSGISNSEKNISELGVKIGKLLSGKRFSSSASYEEVSGWVSSLELPKTECDAYLNGKPTGTLLDALANAGKTDAHIELARNCSVSRLKFTKKSGNITIDGNGNTLTITGTASITPISHTEFKDIAIRAEKNGTMQNITVSAPTAGLTLDNVSFLAKKVNINAVKGNLTARGDLTANTIKGAKKTTLTVTGNVTADNITNFGKVIVTGSLTVKGKLNINELTISEGAVLNIADGASVTVKKFVSDHSLTSIAK